MGLPMEGVAFVLEKIEWVYLNISCDFKLIIGQMLIDKSLLDNLLLDAETDLQLRKHYDLRSSVNDSSQRMLNALLPGTSVPIHRHTKTTETLILLCGKMEEIYYEVVPALYAPGKSLCMDICHERFFKESKRILLEAGGLVQGLCVPVGQWHGINVLEPTVILECKDGAYESLGPEDIIDPGASGE